MKPEELFMNLDEIIDVLGRSTVIDLVSGHPDRFARLTAPLERSVSNLDNSRSPSAYLASLQLELAAYRSLLRLIKQGAFEPTVPPEKISMESLKSGQP